jgi:hypothetical protein
MSENIIVPLASWHNSQVVVPGVLSGVAPDIEPYLSHFVSWHQKIILETEDEHGNQLDNYDPVLSAPVYNVQAFVGDPSVRISQQGEDEVHIYSRLIFLGKTTALEDEDILQWNGSLFVIRGIEAWWAQTALHHLEVNGEEIKFPASARNVP